MKDIYSNISFHPDYCPQFEIGDSVWFIDYNRVEESKIVCVVSKVINKSLMELGGTGLYLILSGYELDLKFAPKELGNGDNLTFVPWCLYKTKEEAEQDAVFYKCENITDQEWIKALGFRNKIPNERKTFIIKKRDSFRKEEIIDIENSELGICCYAISEIRSLLYNCWKNKGLIKRDISKISYILFESGHEENILDSKNFSILNKILKPFESIIADDIKKYEEE